MKRLISNKNIILHWVFPFGRLPEIDQSCCYLNTSQKELCDKWLQASCLCAMEAEEADICAQWKCEASPWLLGFIMWARWMSEMSIWVHRRQTDFVWLDKINKQLKECWREQHSVKLIQLERSDARAQKTGKYWLSSSRSCMFSRCSNCVFVQQTEFACV